MNLAMTCIRKLSFVFRDMIDNVMFEAHVDCKYLLESEDEMTIWVHHTCWLLPDGSVKEFCMTSDSSKVEIVVKVYALAVKALKEAVLGSNWLTEMPALLSLPRCSLSDATKTAISIAMGKASRGDENA